MIKCWYPTGTKAMLNNGQSIIEYVLLVGIATMALMYMGTDFKRGVQSVFKVTVDQLGNQADSDQDFTYQTSGTLVNSDSRSSQTYNKTTQALGNNTTRYLSNSQTESMTNSLTNMSFDPVTYL